MNHLTYTKAGAKLSLKNGDRAYVARFVLLLSSDIFAVAGSSIVLFDGDSFHLVGDFFPFTVKVRGQPPKKALPKEQKQEPIKIKKEEKQEKDDDDADDDASDDKMDDEEEDGGAKSDSGLPVCRYGPSCYRNNPKHFCKFHIHE